MEQFFGEFSGAIIGGGDCLGLTEWLVNSVDLVEQFCHELDVLLQVRKIFSPKCQLSSSARERIQQENVQHFRGHG